MVQEIDSKIVTARKPHKCNYCGCEIEKGQKYVFDTLKFEDSIYRWKSHQECYNATSVLDMMEYADDGITQELFFECINDFIAEKAPHLFELSMYEKVKGVLLLEKGDKK